MADAEAEFEARQYLCGVVDGARDYGSAHFSQLWDQLHDAMQEWLDGDECTDAIPVTLSASDIPALLCALTLVQSALELDGGRGLIDAVKPEDES